MSWTGRTGRVSGPRELQALRDAARDLAEQSGYAPSRARIAFQTVAECAIIGTAVISGAWAAVHLWKAMFPKEKAGRHNQAPDADPRPEAGGVKPPRWRDHHRQAAADSEADRPGRSRA
jgi:hypothetical protein